MTAVARQIDPSGGSDGRKSENRTVRAKKTSPQTRCKAPPRHEVVSGYPVDEHQIASRSVAVPGLPADTTRCRSPVPAVARPLISPTDPGTHLGGVVGARRSGRSLQHLRAARGVAVSPGTANDLSGGSGGRKSENRAVRAKKRRLRRAVRPLHDTRWCLDIPLIGTQIASKPAAAQSSTDTTRHLITSGLR